MRRLEIPRMSCSERFTLQRRGPTAGLGNQAGIFLYTLCTQGCESALCVLYYAKYESPSLYIVQAYRRHSYMLWRLMLHASIEPMSSQDRKHWTLCKGSLYYPAAHSPQLCEHDTRLRVSISLFSLLLDSRLKAA